MYLKFGPLRLLIRPNEHQGVWMKRNILIYILPQTNSEKISVCNWNQARCYKLYCELFIKHFIQMSQDNYKDKNHPDY